MLGTVLAISGVCSARNTSKLDCVSFAEARQHVGTNQCISGTVLHVENGSKGVTFLNFCKDKTCPFTVVVFPADLKKMGAIRQLEGRQVEIKGTVQDYRRTRRDRLAPLPAAGRRRLSPVPRVPTDYDVERPGHDSAGKYSTPKAAKKRLPSRASRFQSKIRTSRGRRSLALGGSDFRRR